MTDGRLKVADRLRSLEDWTHVLRPGLRRVVELALDGWQREAIAAQLKITKMAVSCRLSQAAVAMEFARDGVPRPSRALARPAPSPIAAMTYSEIARELGVTKSAVQQIEVRALLKLRRLRLLTGPLREFLSP